MTNKEAIDRLQRCKRNFELGKTINAVSKEGADERIEAFNLAIKALEEAEEWRKLTAVCAFDGYVVYKERTEANDEDIN